MRERRFGCEFGKGFVEGRLGGVFGLEGNIATRGGWIEAGMSVRMEMRGRVVRDLHVLHPMRELM